MKQIILKILLCLSFIAALIITTSSCGESAGLEFHLLEDNTYTVIGIGDCEDTELVIPKAHEGKPVTQIDKNAFNGNTKITSVTIPEGVTAIGAYAFADCEELVEVTIPSTVTKIDAYAFAGCEDFQKVHISDLAAWCGIAFEDLTANPVFYTHRLYCGGESIRELTIPDGVRTICDYAFTSLDTLISLTLPDSVSEIGEDAFFRCTRLQDVRLSDGITKMRRGAFSLCEALAFAKYGDGCYLGNEQNEYMVLVATKNYELTSLDVHENTKLIADSALYHMKTLKSVTVSDSVTTIGEKAFRDCTALESVALGSGVRSIGKEAFYFCEKLTSINLPDSLESIGYHAFDYCLTLPSITIPDSVTTVEEGAFFACPKITIHCEAKAAPSGWHDNWKQTDRPVIWGYTAE